jgi:hypothetical protein
MDGRVLTEALTGTEPPPLKAERKTLEASRNLPLRVWHQTLTLSQVGSVTYYDEGNGESRLP